MLFNMDSTDDTIITPMGTLGAMNPFFSSHDPYPSNDFNRDENLDQYIGDEHFPAGIDLSEFDFSGKSIVFVFDADHYNVSFRSI